MAALALRLILAVKSGEWGRPDDETAQVSATDVVGQGLGSAVHTRLVDSAARVAARSRVGRIVVAALPLAAAVWVAVVIVDIWTKGVRAPPLPAAPHVWTEVQGALDTATFYVVWVLVALGCLWAAGEATIGHRFSAAAGWLGWLSDCSRPDRAGRCPSLVEARRRRRVRCG